VPPNFNFAITLRPRLQLFLSQPEEGAFFFIETEQERTSVFPSRRVWNATACAAMQPDPRVQLSVADQDHARADSFSVPLLRKFFNRRASIPFPNRVHYTGFAPFADSLGTGLRINGRRVSGVRTISLPSPTQSECTAAGQTLKTICLDRRNASISGVQIPAPASFTCILPSLAALYRVRSVFRVPRRPPPTFGHGTCTCTGLFLACRLLADLVLWMDPRFPRQAVILAPTRPPRRSHRPVTRHWRPKSLA